MLRPGGESSIRENVLILEDRVSVCDQGQGSECDQGQGSEGDQGQGSVWNHHETEQVARTKAQSLPVSSPTMSRVKASLWWSSQTTR